MAQLDDGQLQARGTSRASRRSPRFQWRLVPALRRHPLIGYFLLAYSFSWFVVIVLIMVLGVPADIGTPLVTVGPTAAALIMT